MSPLESAQALSLANQHAMVLSTPWVVVYATAFGFALGGTVLALTEAVARRKVGLLPVTPLENWLGLGELLLRVVSGPIIILNYIGLISRRSSSRPAVLVVAFIFSAFWAFCCGMIALRGLSFALA